MPIVDPRTGTPMGQNEPAKPGAKLPGPSKGQTDESQYIVEVDVSNFQQVVLEGSMQVPVLLDSWAPWCEPCKSLMPVLEKLAREYQGAFVLAKLNIEDNQQIAAQLGIRSVPDVKIIIQGQLYDQFQGALPEGQIREWLGQYIDAPAASGENIEEQAQAALESGDTATAKTLYQQLLAENPEHYDYHIELAGVLAAEEDSAQATEILDALPPEHRDSPKAKGVRARMEFAAEAWSHEQITALGERDDSEARYQRALRAVADGRYDEGLEGLLDVMKRDRSYGEDAARKTLLRAFDVLGNDHPLTVTYRRKLFTLLY
ncbi:thioredoxin family protein [Phytohalomonas tamaricis]|uniref:thioredoxin family protein n=1 Tax=Phytohalomonas tamaricis TaxID=2081032 RepID=UPI000D0BB9A4|nr:co-chaperone YbbN [Phytohalomonas tamaricis]